MSTFITRSLQLLALGAIITIGIAIVTGDIYISKSWFSLRTLQISLGSGLFVLLFIYVQSDRKDLSPQKLKGLVIKSKLVTIFLFAVFLWGIMSKPVIPVNVSFEGVAKTTDVVATKRNVQKANENVSQVGATLSIFKETQDKANTSFSKELSSLKSKIVELDEDEKVRQEETIDQVAGVATEIKKMVVGVDDIKKIDRTPSNSSSVVNTGSISEKNRAWIIVGLLILMVTSFVASFFYTKVPVKMSRYGIPVLALGIIAIMYFYPLIVGNIQPISNKKSPAKDTVVNKEVSVAVDTNKLQKEPVDTTLISSDKSVSFEPDVPVVDSKTKGRKKYSGEKIEYVEYTGPNRINCN